MIVTNGDARRQVENGWHDSTISRMWRNGRDTVDISRALTVHESVAQRRLWQLFSTRVPDQAERGSERIG